MKIVKGASGFGDAIYLRVIVEWLLANRPNDYMILTKYPEVYKDLPVQTADLHSKMYNNVSYYCQYLSGKGLFTTTQWEDMLNRAKLPYFPFTSSLKYLSLLDLTLLNTVIVIPPYNAMNGAKGTFPLIPKFKEFSDYTAKYSDVIYLKQKYPFLDLVKMFSSCKLVVAQQGWATALAEMVDTPIHVIFTKRALNDNYKFISTITPKKILTKPTSKAIIME